MPPSPRLNLALWAPRIPQNTGQLARACHAMRVALHLIRPLGFRMDAASLKRAAVGYLTEMNITLHADGQAFWQAAPDTARVWLVTKHGVHDYRQVQFLPGDTLLMGNEDEGLPPEWLAAHRQQTLRIPMPNPEVRCLNLATAATAVMFEALRQLDGAKLIATEPVR